MPLFLALLDLEWLECVPGSTRAGSSPGAAEAGRAATSPGVPGVDSARAPSEGGDAGDASADHARPPPSARASDRQPGWNNSSF